MESIYKSVGILCMYAYITGIVCNLSGVNSNGKYLKLICSLYIIIVAFSPVSGIEFSFEYPGTVQIETSDTADEYVIKQAVTNIENIICERLNKENISYSFVKVHIHKQTAGLSISQVDIYGSGNNEKDRIINLLDDITSKEKIKFQGE